MTKLLAVLFISTLSINMFGQTDKVSINPNLDTISSTNVCTKFQIPHCITTCTAELKADNLIIKFHDQTVSTFDDITLIIHSNNIDSKYKTVYMVLDKNGKTEWLPLKQIVTLNTDNIKKDKTVKGFLDLEFQEIYVDQNGAKKNTIKILFSGNFVTTIK